VTLTFNPYINRVIFAKTNAPEKFEGKVPMRCCLIDQKPFCLGECHPDPLTPKINLRLYDQKQYICEV
jgi:hypothetical protein